MRIEIATVRNVVIGAGMAAFLSFGSSTLQGFDGCPQETLCTSGALFGYTIGCGCDGPGDCEVVQEGYEVECNCEFFPKTHCDCDGGCNDV